MDALSGGSQPNSEGLDPEAGHRSDFGGKVALVLAVCLLALIASEALFEVRLVLSTPETMWSGLVAVCGLAGLPFIAALTLGLGRRRPRASIVRSGASTLAISYASALVFALAFAPHPVASVADASAYAVFSALAASPVLLPAMVYAARTARPHPAVVAVLVSVCVLMPTPAVGGGVLGTLLLWRRALTDRLP